MGVVFNRYIGGSGGSGEYASIFVTGLQESDTITCTSPSGKSVSGVWTSKVVEGVTINGWRISPITEYAHYLVTATRGQKTTTEEVYVDAAEEYDIEMFFGLKLYWDGDECEGVTGGWIKDKNRDNSGWGLGTYTVNSGDITFSAANYPKACGMVTSNKINLNDYSYLKSDVVLKGWGMQLNTLSANTYFGQTHGVDKLDVTSARTGDITLTLSTKGINYVGLGCYCDTSISNQSLKVTKVWLE